MPDKLDDATRTYTVWNEAGDVVEQRPYNARENEELDARLAAQRIIDAREQDRVTVREIITALQAEKDRVDVVIAKTNAQITPNDTKDVARAAKRIADAAISLARFVKDL